MRKIKEVLRLRFELGLGQREIGRACSISQSAVHKYLKKAAEAEIGWPLPEGWDGKRLEEAVFGKQLLIEQSSPRIPPDFSALHDQLQKHPHLTLQLAREEYREKNPKSYRYSRFCELYQRWRRKQDVVLRQEHKAGEKGFVDWAGATIPLQDAETGSIWQASLFVADCSPELPSWEQLAVEKVQAACIPSRSRFWLTTRPTKDDGLGG